MNRVNVSRTLKAMIAVFAAIVLFVSMIPVAIMAETETVDYYNAQLTISGLGVTETYDNTGEVFYSAELTPTFYSPWVNIDWGDSYRQGIRLLLSDNHVLETGEALLFYVKLPENAPETTIGIRFSAQTDKSTYITLHEGSTVSLMPKTTRQWADTSTVNGASASNLGVTLPAGFEGWVRIPYGSFNLAAQGWTSLDFYYVRLYPTSAVDGMRVGAFAVVDNGTSNLDKIRINDNNTPVRLFPKIYTQETADTAVIVDKSFETLPAEDGILGSNPDRGFRSEEKYILSAEEIAEVASMTDAELQTQIKKETQLNTRGESPMVSRLYFKMQEYATADKIPDDAVTYMNRILAAYKAIGVRSYVSIYYTSDPDPENPDTIPATGTILAHMDQYKTVLETSKDAIVALCFGLIGDDGEWDYVVYDENGIAHATKLTDDEYTAVVTKMLTDTLPDDMYLTLRKPSYKQTYVEPLLADGTITQDRFNRIGFDEAGMYGLDTNYGGGTWKPGSEEWNYGMEQAPYAYNDAETAVTKSFYTNNYTNPSGTKHHLDASALQSMSQQWTATFSAYHSNADHGSTYTYEHTNFYYWKNDPAMKVTAQSLTNMGLPFTANWFKDGDGNTVPRNVYDYLRDHLGYRLSMKSLTVTGGECVDETISVNAVLNNYGYGAPVTMTESGFAILDEGGNVVSFTAAGTPAQWYSTDPTDYTDRTQLDHTINAALTLPEEIGTYRLAFYLRNSAGQSVRLDNTTPYENGYQILHTFEVIEKDHYNATMATLTTPDAGTGSTATLVTDDVTGLTPTLPSNWAKWVWNDITAHNNAKAAQHPLKLNGVTLTEGSALLFYVKLPAAAPATQIGFRLSDDTNYNLSIGKTVYLLSVDGEAWEATTTVANSRQSGLGYVPFPAGFEGWVRIPYESTALTAALTPNRIRIYIAAVDNSFANDGFSVGAVSIVDNADQNFYKIKTDDAAKAVPLFYTLNVPTNVAMDRVYFSGNETYLNEDGTANSALRVTLTNGTTIGDYNGSKLYYQYTPTGASESVKVALIRAGSPNDETAIEIDRTNVTEFYIPALQGTNGAIIAGDVAEDVTVVGTSAWYSEDNSGTKSYTYDNNGEDYFKIRFTGRAARETEIGGVTYKLKNMAVKVTAPNGAGAAYYVQSKLADICTDYVDFVKVLTGPVSSKGDVVYTVNAICTYVSEDGSTRDVQSADFVSKAYNDLPKPQ